MGKSIEYQGAQMATVIWVPKDAVKLKVKAKCKDGTKMEMVLDELFDMTNPFLHTALLSGFVFVAWRSSLPSSAPAWLSAHPDNLQ